MSEFSLFNLPPTSPDPVPFMHIVRDEPQVFGFDLRDYQIEDVVAVEAALAVGRRAVLARQATGLGKSVMIAELSLRLSKFGRVMVTVDVTALATDLADSIYRHTGIRCGVYTGEAKRNIHAQIVVSTVQTLYTKDKRTGRRAYEELFDVTRERWSLLVDECESSIADEFNGVCKYWLAGRPDNVIIGTTATPMRGDGRGMGELYDHAVNDPGPLNRDIQWAIDQGWLVTMQQAFVRVGLDFNTLKVTRSGDYSDDDIAALLRDETKLREFAIGMHKVCEGQQSIAICPTGEIAQKLMMHLCALQPGIAQAAYRKMGRRQSDEAVAAFKRGEFPYLISVAMLWKGFDYDEVRNVVMLRKTRSRRLYEQSLGRGTRPLKGIRAALASAPDAAARRAIILASAKPGMTMVDLVGINEKAKDLGVIDILAGNLSDECRERAKKKMVEKSADGEKVDVEKMGRDEAAAMAEERRLAEARELRKRQAAEIKASHVEIERTKNMKRTAGASLNDKRLDNRVLSVLRGEKVKEHEMIEWGPEKARTIADELLRRKAKGLASWAQRRMVRDFRKDLSREQIRQLSVREASEIIAPRMAGFRQRSHGRDAR